MLSWEQLGHLPQQVSSTILKSLREIVDDVIAHTVDASGGELNQSLCTLSKTIPIDIRTVHRMFDESKDLEIYHCCPTCRGVLQRKVEGDTTCNMPRVGKHQYCTHKLTPLTVEHFYHYPMASYIDNLLREPGLESQLGSVWTKTSLPGVYNDVWDGSIVKNLKWPSKLDDPSYIQATSPLKLVWALYVDWHNPFHNKLAGKKASVGSIQLVCLNLPPSERYKSHYRLLSGIIPGPKEPDVDEFPAFLKKTVDDLTNLFNGVFLTRTSAFPNGRAVHCCLGPVVCDLPATRKVAGFTSHNSSQQCHVCDFHGASKDEKHKLRISIDKNRRRTKETIFNQSGRYLALTATNRIKEAQKTGIRYSELN